MVTRWYFRSSNASTGPTGKASTDTDTWPSYPTDKNTAKDMTFAKGSSQTSVTSGANWSSGSSPLYGLLRIFVGPALIAQTITGSQAYTFACALMENNTQMNLYARLFAYVWRSGTGNAHTLVSPASSTAGDDTAETGLVISGTIASGDWACNADDRIVVEFWGDTRNSKSVAYSATGYYEGTTDPINDTATSDAASYFELTQDLLTSSASKALSSSITISKPGSKALSSSVQVQNKGSAALTSSITVQKPGSYSLPSSFTVQASDSEDLSSSFVILKPSSADLSSSFEVRVSPTIVSPKGGEQVTVPFYMIFTSTTISAVKKHFEIQVDKTSSSFGDLEINPQSKTDQTNWTYWDGDSWEPIPADGMDPTYYGNNVRYYVTSMTQGNKWWHVREIKREDSW